MIDAHVHFWSLAEPHHQWPTPAEAAIHRDYGPDDWRRERGDIPVDGVVLVQSQPTESHSHWLLSLADREPAVRAVVAWADLAAPDAPAWIAALAECPKLRGLRPMLQAIANTDWLLDPALIPALAAMSARSLRLDALVQPRHLPMLRRFREAWPDLPVVIDHAAKPDASRGELDPWRAEIAVLARQGAWCKLSGLRTEQAAGQPAEALAPYVEHLVACFGERLMWGSDWPVIHLAGDDYTRWYRDAARLAEAAGADLDRLFGGAARAFYAIDG